MTTYYKHVVNVYTTERETTMETHFTCIDCKLEKPVQHDFGTGYAVLKGDDKLCYECWGKRDKADMITFGEAVLYVRGRDLRHCVTNWPGTLRIEPNRVRVSRNGGGFGCQRTDVWFKGPDGANWHGVNRGYNDVLRCKRIK